MIIELGLWPDQDRQINCLRPAEILAKDRSSLEPDTRRKLLWDNAARFYKQT